MTALLFHFRIRGEYRLQHRLVGRVIQEHSGIIFQVNLGDTEFLATVQFHQERKDHQALAVQLRDRFMYIRLLERIHELFLKCSLFTVHVRRKSHMVGRESIIGFFIHDDDIILHLRRETIGQTVIIHTENKAVVTPERECHFIIDILYFRLFIERRRDHFIDCGFQHFRDFGAGP